MSGDSVLGWILALAIDGAILVAFGLTMFFALAGTRRYLREREVGDFAMGVVIVVTFCALLIGAWLPVGVFLVGRRVWRRGGAAATS